MSIVRVSNFKAAFAKTLQDIVKAAFKPSEHTCTEICRPIRICKKTINLLCLASMKVYNPFIHLPSLYLHGFLNVHLCTINRFKA